MEEKKKVEPILQTRELCRFYTVGDTQVKAVNQISIPIYPGQLTVLRGRSGSGKTTLINLLSTLDTPTSGTILYGDQDITQFSEEQKNQFRRKDIGIIFQAVALMSQMTAMENVEFGLRMAGVPYGEHRELAQRYLNLVGLGKRMKHLPGELSGGEQQRIAIARALAHSPRIIFADEPTAELDTATALHMVKLFKDLIEEQQMTVVMTTHDPNMMEVADTVYSLRDGEVVDDY
ncbi:MAG: ABC transporter ATP-binding protein [Massiliimalia sp.]